MTILYLRLLRGHTVNNQLPCLFYDGIFAVLATIVPKFPNESEALQLLNMKLSGLREGTEHIFADHKGMFQLLDRPRYLSLFIRGVHIRRLFTMSFFIQNCYICINGGRCRYFGYVPPSLEEYIPLDEVIAPPPPVNLGDVWYFQQ